MTAILFDWDGTLADSLGLLTRANADVLAGFGLPFDAAAYQAAYTPDWRRTYRRLGIPADRLEEANERWLAAYAGGVTVELFPGVVGALESLHLDGHRLGLVTAGRGDVVGPQLERTGLAGLFGATVFGDTMAEAKPHPAPLRLALRQLDADGRPADATYVGDVADDMRMARSAGVRGVGIVSRFGTEADLRAAGAAEVATSVIAWVEARAASFVAPG
jgi:phosphoglycolate phosphatase